jgi:CPA2 family monovalent cation:H+ antiporter-2
MTIVLNILAGQFVAWLNKLGPQAGINTTVILQNRGEFALILATLSLSAGLDPRIVPFAGLYVLSMSVIGPVLAVNSERIGAVVLGTGRRARSSTAERDRMRDESIALLEAVSAGQEAAAPGADPVAPVEEEPGIPVGLTAATTTESGEAAAEPVDPIAAQAAEQSDAVFERKKDPEY